MPREAIPVTTVMVNAALDAWWEETLAGSSEQVRRDLMARTRPRMQAALLAGLRARGGAARPQPSAAEIIRDYWDANGELIETNNGARLAFEAIAAAVEEAER